MIVTVIVAASEIDAVSRGHAHVYPEHRVAAVLHTYAEASRWYAKPSDHLDPLVHVAFVAALVHATNPTGAHEAVSLMPIQQSHYAFAMNRNADGLRGLLCVKSRDARVAVGSWRPDVDLGFLVGGHAAGLALVLVEGPSGTYHRVVPADQIPPSREGETVTRVRP